jgi:hypothetical protein
MTTQKKEKKSTRSQEEILEIAKGLTKKWVDAVDFCGVRDEDTVLAELSKRTFEGEPVLALVASCPKEAVKKLKEGAAQILGTDDPDKIAEAIKDAYQCKWDYYYMAFYECAMEAAEINHPFTDQSFFPAVKAGLGHIVNLGGLIVGVMLPELAVRDENGRIHCETGPAIIWGDDKQYWWHGTQISAEWIENKNERTAKEALEENNAEKRRAYCEIIGWEKILSDLDAEVVDKDKSPAVGTLLRVDLPAAKGSQFLKVRCGTGRTFALPVPENMKTAIEAQAWMYQITEAQARLAAEFRT